jgi:hypothetical protein
MSFDNPEKVVSKNRCQKCENICSFVLSHLCSEMLLDFLRLPLRIDVQDCLVGRHDRISLEHRVERNVLAPHVEEPGDLVESGEHGGVVARLAEAAAKRGQLGLPTAT